MAELEDNYTHKKRTICEVHREIRDILIRSDSSEKDEILRLLSEAYGMAKSMDTKLREYKLWSSDLLPDNANYEKSKQLRYDNDAFLKGKVLIE